MPTILAELEQALLEAASSEERQLLELPITELLEVSEEQAKAIAHYTQEAPTWHNSCLHKLPSWTRRTSTKHAIVPLHHLPPSASAASLLVGVTGPRGGSWDRRPGDAREELLKQLDAWDMGEGSTWLRLLINDRIRCSMLQASAGMLLASGEWWKNGMGARGQPGPGLEQMRRELASVGPMRTKLEGLVADVCEWITHAPLMLDLSFEGGQATHELMGTFEAVQGKGKKRDHRLQVASLQVASRCIRREFNFSVEEVKEVAQGERPWVRRGDSLLLLNMLNGTEMLRRPGSGPVRLLAWQKPPGGQAKAIQYSIQSKT